MFGLNRISKSLKLHLLCPLKRMSHHSQRYRMWIWDFKNLPTRVTQHFYIAPKHRMQTLTITSCNIPVCLLVLSLLLPKECMVTILFMENIYIFFNSSLALFMPLCYFKKEQYIFLKNLAISFSKFTNSCPASTIEWVFLYECVIFVCIQTKWHVWLYMY